MLCTSVQNIDNMARIARMARVGYINNTNILKKSAVCTPKFSIIRYILDELRICSSQDARFSLNLIFRILSGLVIEFF